MLLHRILSLEEENEIFLAEESLEDMITLPVTSEILESGIESDEGIEIEGLGVAVHMTEPAEFWLLLTDRYSEKKVLENHSDLLQVEATRKVNTSDGDFFEAIVEYYAESLANELLCESCFETGSPLHVEDRIERLETFLEPILGKNCSMLEICCGSGMATQALLHLGYAPWSMDTDRCDLCQALKGGYLNPRRSFLLDARLLGRFFLPHSFEIVTGFMVGLIDGSNWPVWKDILLGSSRLAKDKALFTVYTEKEARVIAKTLGEAGWKGEVIDNRDPKGIYDQWAYLASRDS